MRGERMDRLPERARARERATARAFGVDETTTDGGALIRVGARGWECAATRGKNWRPDVSEG